MHVSHITALVVAVQRQIQQIPVSWPSAPSRSSSAYHAVLNGTLQISFGLTAIYTISLVSAYKEALAGAPPAVASDYFVFYVEVPGQDGSSPGD